MLKLLAVAPFAIILALTPAYAQGGGGDAKCSKAEMDKMQDKMGSMSGDDKKMAMKEMDMAGEMMKKGDMEGCMMHMDKAMKMMNKS